MGISSDPEKRAIQIANLKPIKPGEVRNPRRNAGRSVKEWFNQMGEYTEKMIQAILKDPKAPVKKKAAAQTWMNAIRDGAANSLNSIMDRTDGKPTETMNVMMDYKAEVNVMISPAAIALQQRIADRFKEYQEDQGIVEGEIVESLPSNNGEIPSNKQQIDESSPTDLLGQL